MKIAQIAPIYLPLPPGKLGRGGTEIIVSHTTNELVNQGHDVTLFASGNSKTDAKLEYLFPKSLRDDPAFEKWGATVSNNFTLSHIVHALNQAGDFDVVHTHFEHLIAPLTSMIKTPVVNTCHYLIKPRLHKFNTEHYPNCHYVSISNNQRRGLEGFAATVYNGLDLNEVKYNDKPEDDFFVTCGRVTPDKGADQAVAAVKKYGGRLFIGGKVYDNIKKSVKYYKEKLEQHIDGQQITMELVPHDELLKKMAQAKAFIFPINWEEPFGLVMIEAMACGTPVIAYRHGAVPEVVEDGKTGFIVDNVDQMIDAMKKIDTIDRAACRKHVENNFSIAKTTKDYVKVYKKVLGI